MAVSRPTVVSGAAASRQLNSRIQTFQSERAHEA